MRMRLGLAHVIKDPKIRRCLHFSCARRRARGMSDILTQFDMEERAEQARHRGGGGDDAILSGGGGGGRGSLNPFDGPGLQSPAAAMQVSSGVCVYNVGNRLWVGSKS